jgi:hypothetical protein
VAGLLLIIGPATACSDDDPSPEEAFCEAGDSLRADVDGLADLDLIAGGTNALNERVEAIRTDIDELKKSGTEVAKEEVGALETTVDELRAALEAVGDDVTVDGARDAAAAASGVIEAAGAVFDKLAATCP